MAEVGLDILIDNRRQDKSNHSSVVVAKDFLQEGWLWCIDEFQATDIATTALLGQILREMFNRGAVIITTSNRLPEGNLYIAPNHKRNLQG